MGVYIHMAAKHMAETINRQTVANECEQIHFSPSLITLIMYSLGIISKINTKTFNTVATVMLFK